jgi:hypothetical protein
LIWERELYIVLKISMRKHLLLLIVPMLLWEPETGRILHIDVRKRIYLFIISGGYKNVF